MTPPTTPRYTLLHRIASRRDRDDTVLAYIGDGFNDTTFKARVMSSTSRPEDIGADSDGYSRDEFEPCGGMAEPFAVEEVDPMF